VSGPLIYLLAGEASGDLLGASLMRALRTVAPGVRFSGVGGREMQAAGLKPLFDMTELSVMGLAEVLPRLPTLLRRIRQTAADVLAQRPAALVTIDAPSFGLRVSQRVRGTDPAIRTIHYVAPSVWAWRPGRARHMAQFTDHVLALLPFEPPLMRAAGMTCDFVGHPIAEKPMPTEAETAVFRARIGVGAAQPLLLLAPGSRRGEVNRMMPVYAAVVASLRARIPDLALVVPVAETVREALTGALTALDPAPALILPEDGETAKLAGFAAADAALVKSGTTGLEMAAAGTAHVSCFRTSWLTGAIVRRLVRVDTAHLVNLVSGERVVPECLQEHCTAPEIVARLAPLLDDPAARAAQTARFAAVLDTLGRGGEPPSLRAARSVLEALPGR
jgi:lipid-A-disaccharide synthase